MHTACRLMVAVAACWLATAAGGAEFRVTSRVYRADEAEPISESVTLFAAGRVYDTLVGRAGVSVFNTAVRRLTLVDSEQGVQTELTAEELGEFEKAIRAWCSRQTEPVLAFLAAPKFEEFYSAKSGTLKLTHEAMSYEVQTQAPPQPGHAAQFVEFASTMARANCLLNPGGLPPFGRLVLDRALASHGRLPTRVELRYRAGSGPQARTLKLRSEHEYAFQLDNAAREQIAEIDRHLASARRVAFRDYQAPASARRQ